MESLSQKSKIFASSLVKGSLRRAAGVNAHGSLLRIVASLTRPVSLLRCSRCTDQSPPCQRGVVLPLAKPGGFRGGQISTWVCAFGKCLLWNPSVTASPCQLPLAREPFYTRYRSMVRCRAFSIFQSTAWDKNVPKSYKSITGAEAKTPHPSQSEGSIPRWFHPGDS